MLIDLTYSPEFDAAVRVRHCGTPAARRVVRVVGDESVLEVEVDDLCDLALDGIGVGPIPTIFALGAIG